MRVTEDRIDWSAVVEWFGHVPRFHDAEIVSIALNRWPKPSIIRVHAFRVNPETDAGGYFRLDKHALVTFELDDIQEQDLEGWNHQNAMMAISVAEDGEWLRLTLEGAYGVDGSFLARDIRVSLEPWSEPLVAETAIMPGYDPA